MGCSSSVSRPSSDQQQQQQQQVVQVIDTIDTAQVADQLCDVPYSITATEPRVGRTRNSSSSVQLRDSDPSAAVPPSVQPYDGDDGYNGSAASTSLRCTPALRDESPLAVVSKGITLRGLRKLRVRLQAAFGDAYTTMSTTDVSNAWVKVVTQASQCRLAELVSVVDPSDLGVPHYFVSHAWHNRFELLMQGIEGFLQSAAEDTRVWLDIVAVNEHAGTTYQAVDVAALKDVIKAATGGTLVVMDLTNCNPASRAWCIYEWAATLAAHGPDGLHMPLNAEDRVTLVSSLDVSAAECFRGSDKARILSDVVAQHGSTTTFNDSLKLQLMLQPLSYRVDLRRLLARSQGTVWEFGLVQEWLEAGSDGPRVLAIMAGAGEGKSTISAALCEADITRSCLAGHHFIKYSDQRRLDPVRVIGSLAFQLAQRCPELSEALFSANTLDLATTTDPAVVFDELLRKPIALLEQQPLTFLIDALDEADPAAQLLPNGGSSAPSMAACGNKLYQLLSRHLSLLPPHVRFIVTTRPDAVSGSIRVALARAFQGSVKIVSAAELRSTAPAVTAGSTCTSDGNSSNNGGCGILVYHTVVSECLGGSSQRTAAPTMPYQLPELAAPPCLSDLHDAYTAVFRAGMSAPGLLEEDLRLMQALLGVLLASQEPLPHSLLHAMGLGRALELLPGYPVTFFIEQDHHAYSLHKSLSEWLGDARVSGSFAVDVCLGHATLAGQLQLSVQSGHPSVYTLKYLVRHLVACGDSRSLEVLLCDYTFLAAVFSAGHGHVAIRDLLSMANPSPLMADAQCWLLAQQHDLVGAKTVGDVVATGLRCPLGSPAFQRAWKAYRRSPAPPAVEASAGGAHQQQQPRLRHRLGAPWMWPALRLVMKGHKSVVLSVAWRPDGATLASGGYDKSVRLWDTASGECLAVLGQEDIISVAWRPDGAVLASGSSSGTVRLWDAASGECMAVLKGHTGSITSVAWHPDGVALASGSGDKSTCVWDATSGERTAVLLGHVGPLASVAWRPGGGGLASSGSDDKCVRLWDASSSSSGSSSEWQCMAVLTGHEEGVRSVAWRPDGTMLASGAKDKTVRLWVMTNGEWQCTAILKGHIDLIFSVAWRPDGLVLASGGGGGDRTVRLWDAASRECTVVLKGHQHVVTSVAWSPDGTSLASGSGDGRVRLWDAAVSSSAGGDSSMPSAVAAVAGGSGAEISERAVPSGKLPVLQANPGPSRGHEDDVSCVAWGCNGALLASGSHDKTVRLWNATSGECVAILGHGSAVTSVAWRPAGGMMLASGAGDKNVRLWDAASGGEWQCAAVLKGHDSAIDPLGGVAP